MMIYRIAMGVVSVEAVVIPIPPPGVIVPIFPARDGYFLILDSIYPRIRGHYVKKTA